MTDRRELPKPPSKGPRGRFQEHDPERAAGAGDGLLADRMSMAMAAGKLDEFMEREFGDNEGARRMAQMMMGFSGMMPMGGGMADMAGAMSGAMSDNSAAPSGEGAKEPGSVGDDPSTSGPQHVLSEDVMQAVGNGDVSALKDMLMKEYAQRTGVDPEELRGKPVKAAQPQVGDQPQSGEAPQWGVEKALLDALLAIANDNSVTLDWVFERALKLYVRDYKATGRM